MNALVQKWGGHEEGLAQTPDWLLVSLVLAAALLAVLYVFALGQAAPAYLEMAHRVPAGEWGWQGWLLTAVAGGLGWLVWHFGVFAVRCGSLLKQRWSV